MSHYSHEESSLVQDEGTCGQCGAPVAWGECKANAAHDVTTKVTVAMLDKIAAGCFVPTCEKFNPDSTKRCEACQRRSEATFRMFYPDPHRTPTERAEW